MVGNTALGAWKRVTQSSALLMWRGVVLLLGYVPTNDNVNSEFVVGVKPDDFGVVIGYQVDEFTHAWLECFIP